MLNVALTGNIAAGKLTVIELFRGWGATISDADELVRQAQAPGGEVLAAIAQRCGADGPAPDGSPDRAAPRSKVMGGPAALGARSAIARPALRRRRQRPRRAARARPAQSLLVAAADGEGKRAAAPLDAIVERYSDAGLAVRRVTGGSAVEKALARADPPPDAIVATAGAAASVERAWERAGRPGLLVLLSDDPDPVAVRLDLRPWGADRLRLVEPGGRGVAPRPDLF